MPEYEAAISDLVSELLRSLMVARDPIFGRIRHETVDHLPDGSVPGNAAVGIMRPVGARYNFAIDVKALLEADLDAWAAMISDAADGGLAEIMPQFFALVEEASSKAGTAVDGRGKPFGWDVFFDGIEAVEIDFDDDGKAKMPTLVVSPSTFERIQALGPPDDAQRARFERLIEAKRADFDARRRVRRLA